MLKRFLAAIFGALLVAILFPLGYWLVLDSVPFDNFNGLLVLVGVGAGIGAALGALFPGPFGFIFEMFLDI